MSKESKDQVSAIDRAIAAAKARKEAKAGGTAPATEGDAPSKKEKEPKPAKPKLSDEEKAAAQAAKDAERAAKKAERDRLREEKRAAREQDRRTPHMSKVEKAAARLPTLNEQAQLMFNDITTNFSRDQVAALSAHLNHFNRVKATERALGQKIEAGNTVRIVGGDPRFIGQVGTVFKAQRIRCYVEVPGARKPVYLFTSDVELVDAAAKAANG